MKKILALIAMVILPACSDGRGTKQETVRSNPSPVAVEHRVSGCDSGTCQIRVK